MTNPKLINTIQLVFIMTMFVALSCKKHKNSTDESDTTQIPTSTQKALKADFFTTVEIPVSIQPITLSDIAKTLYKAPSSPYGLTSYIDYRVNEDNTMDVYWQDVNDKAHISRVSLTSQSIIEDIKIPNSITKISQGYYGFEKMGQDKFILGYSAQNDFGQEKSEAWCTAFNKDGSIIFSTLLFGNENLDSNGTKGMPSKGGSGVIRYNAATNKIAVYTSHTQRAGGDRHQAGWLGFLDATTGQLIMDGTKQAGESWHCSHNFDQRGLFNKDGMFYTLAHGDAYPRALAASVFSTAKAHNIAQFFYFKIAGSNGVNATNANTGDFFELENRDVAVVYSTSDGRASRDLKIALLAGMNTGSPIIRNEAWLTKLSSYYVGWGPKVIQYSKSTILVGWNTFNGKTGMSSYFQLVNLNADTLYPTYKLSESVLYPAQQFRYSNDKKTIYFISAGTMSLRIHAIKVDETY